MEDLWTFNEEVVVRAVAACAKPVVSAVGHETDVTLCDLAADLRAPTPSAAAECVVPLRSETEAALAAFKEAMQEAALGQIERRQHALALLSAKLSSMQPGNRLEAAGKRLAQLKTSMNQAMQMKLLQGENRLAQRRRELEMLSPYRVLARGYALATKDGAPVKSCAQLAAGDTLKLRFADGEADVRVLP